MLFVSAATNLLPGGSGAFDVYRVDRTTGTIIRALASVLGYGIPAVSDDGNVVAMIAGIPNRVVVADIAAGEVTTLPAPYILQPTTTFTSAHLEYTAISVSGDGRRIGYVSFAYYYHGAPYEDPRFHVYERASEATTDVTSGYMREPSLIASGDAAIIPRRTGTVRRVLASGCRNVPVRPAARDVSALAALAVRSIHALPRGRASATAICTHGR